MSARQDGFSLIEVLVTIGILMVGLLGLAALQTNATIAEMEAYQRSQALVLAQDLADRISANKAKAADYIKDDIGLAAVDCAGKTAAALDLCEWGNQVNGAAEVTAGGTKVGAMIGARGCVTLASANVYMVTVAWQGFSKAGAEPAVACGTGKYGTGQRRTVSQIVRVALLAA
ncbi:MAG: type IV pilus modification protein PilV [Myxococcales bacterium]|nr:type IV pilus modification protein PilV [Myxococcales bacterium]